MMSTSRPSATLTVAVCTCADLMPLASYINLSARWISSAASFRATPRRSATGPSRRQTTPTSTFTGRAASRRSSRDQSWASTASLNRAAMSTACAAPGRSGIRKQNSSPPNRACRSRPSIPRSDREEVLRADLIGENARDALDDLVADGVPERVVVPLEAVDIDDADAAPADALLDGEERLDALHEPVEVEQLGLRIAMGLVGQIGDDFLEVARDVADRDVLFGELPLEALHLGREALRQRADRVVLRLLDELPLPRHDLFDPPQQFRRALGLEVEPRLDPIAEIRGAARLLVACRAVGPAHVAGGTSSRAVPFKAAENHGFWLPDQHPATRSG